MSNSFATAKGFALQHKEDSLPDRLVISTLKITTVAEVLPPLSKNPSELDLSFLEGPGFKDFFGTEKGQALLSRTLTGGTNWYGTVIEDSTSGIADFAAFIIPYLETTKPRLAKTQDLVDGTTADEPLTQKKSL
jgi:hypothetical protein